MEPGVNHAGLNEPTDLRVLADAGAVTPLRSQVLVQRVGQTRFEDNPEPETVSLRKSLARAPSVSDGFEWGHTGQEEGLGSKKLN